MNDFFLPEFQLSHNVLGDFGRGGGSDGNHRGVHDFADFADIQIVGPEVIAPLRYAMCLIHNNIGQVHMGEVPAEEGSAQSLGGEVEKFAIPISGVVQGKVHFLGRHTRVDGQSLDSTGVEVLHLVFHQGYERSHDQRHSLLHHRGHLETHRLASTCGQNCKHILTSCRGTDYFVLLRPE